MGGNTGLVINGIFSNREYSISHTCRLLCKDAARVVVVDGADGQSQPEQGVLPAPRLLLLGRRSSGAREPSGLDDSNAATRRSAEKGSRRRGPEHDGWQGRKPGPMLQRTEEEERRRRRHETKRRKGKRRKRERTRGRRRSRGGERGKAISRASLSAA